MFRGYKWIKGGAKESLRLGRRNEVEGGGWRVEG